MEHKYSLQNELDVLLTACETDASPPALLLHACCAPCSSHVLEYLARHFLITIDFYNPNIFPGGEYARRLAELGSLLERAEYANPVTLRECEHDPGRFESAVRGLEREPEGGARCEACFRLRLGHTAAMAEALGFDYFTTTLSVSPHKNAALLDQIALELEAAHGVKRLPSDFKKRGGYQRSIALSREYGLYRQDYCGCAFSRRQM